MPYKDPEKEREYHKQYQKKWQKKNREKVKVYSKKWYTKTKKENPERLKAYDRKRYQRSLKRRTQIKEAAYLFLRRKREEAINKLGGVCKRCNFFDSRALQIDHINGDGHKERRLNKKTMFNKIINNKADNYQLLCANCNWIKRSENKEYHNAR